MAAQIPLWDFVEGKLPHIVLSDGSLSTGAEVGLKDVECLDNQSLNDFTMALRKGLNSIPEGATVQFYLKVGSDYSNLINSHEAAISTDCKALVRRIAENRISGFKAEIKEQDLYLPRLFVFVRTKVKSFKRKGLFSTEEEFSMASAEEMDESLNALSESLDSCLHAFNLMNVASRRLSLEEMRGLLFGFLNPNRSLEFECAKQMDYPHTVSDTALLAENSWLRDPSPRSQIVFGDLVLDYEQFVLDAHYHKVITLKAMPEVTVAGQLASLLRMPFHYDLFLSFEVPNQADEMEALKRKRRMAHSLASTAQGEVSDLESETKLNSTEGLLRELLNTGQKLFVVQLQIVLRAPVSEGLKNLNRNAKEVVSRVRGLQGAEALEEQLAAWAIVKGNLPGLPIRLERKFKMKTNNLADFLPIYGPSAGDREPVVILKNRLGGLVSLDAFDSNLPNFNALVTGSSGAGKSFLNNCILLQELARSQRVFIIDIGGSYKKLTNSLGGQYFELSLENCPKMNPFHLEDPSKPPTDQRLKNLQASIESMVTEENGRIAKLDRVKLEKAINEVYEIARGKFEIPTLSDLRKVLLDSSEQSLKDLGTLLYSWTENRPYGKLLDGQGSFQTNAPICTFDLKGLSSHPDLQRVMVLLLTDFILTEVEKDRSVRKRIILDEAWELLKSSAAANFMEYCARTLRKTGSGITFITQGVEEIVSSPIGPAILNNTATKLVLLQRGDIEVLRKTLKLNPREISLIHGLEQRKGKFSEAFLMKGGQSQVVRIAPSPIEYWLSTSDAKDNAALENLLLGGQTLEEAIVKAAELFPFGVANKETG